MKNLRITVSFLCLIFIPIIGIAQHNNDFETKAIIHVYRPSKVAGFGWAFKLKANGNKIAKIKNGKHVVLAVEPGNTNLEMNKNKIKMDLKAGHVYYFRVSITRNLLIGKPELLEVTETFAKTEISD